ncbi:pro-sigmaK processing inhibitor BofA family protein [Paenibacillus beijingensis]|uniref:Pro-sigmaK processing inhibitor BofA n=1 Tax=Paenibacillus beijingensis TaxID=1126833 RepID=A0A0D5NJ39_9BACL|nr:pro-sigmaK processing inhibitor BofA family protein [Paenibacillus beijingensis]AJY75012.1 pro-sigmaK processing inhibitor BofA [Paenibacillus beijingensis]
MKWVWSAMLAVSSLLLIAIVVRQRISWAWFSRFALHLTAAAVVLYLLNSLSVIPGVQIPLNPTTIGTVVVLGIPGVALIAGLQAVLF